MKKKEIIENLFQVSEKTYYNHKNADKPVINLIEKYFTDDDLIEFLTTKEISRFKNVKNIKIENESLKKISFSLFDSVFIDLVQITRLRIDRVLDSCKDINYNIFKLPFFVILTVIDKLQINNIRENEIKELIYEIIIVNKTYLDYDRVFAFISTHNKMLCQIIKSLKNDELRLEYFESSNIHKISVLYKLYNSYKEMAQTEKDLNTSSQQLLQIKELYK